MRSVLAFSALLLLPLLSSGQMALNSSLLPATTLAPATSTKLSTWSTTPDGTVVTSNSDNQIIATTVSNPGVTTVPVQQNTTVTNDNDKKAAPDNPSTTTGGSKENKTSGITTTLTGLTSTAKSESTSSKNETIQDEGESGHRSSHNISTNLSPKEATQMTSPPSTMVNTSETTPTLSSTFSSISNQSTGSHVTPKHHGGSPEKQNTSAAPSSSSGMMTSPTFTSQGKPTTTRPLTTFERNQQVPSGIPASSGTSASTALQPVDTSSGSMATPPVRGPTSSSSKSASTVPQDFNISPSSALGNNRIKCETLERPDEKMLILNLTKTNLCAEDHEDDKLVTVLCQAAKATYNPAQDQCHIRLATFPKSQLVIVKEITVQTILLPRDVYELLKNKWDDLKEVGVSNMQFGDQGPPEEAEDRFSMPLIITIVCMASFLLLVAALYGCCHQRLSQRKDQQRLTEELQTVENGYHDNPTLEVMETSSEMQEKKVVNLNGELGDSWIVPLDNLTKDDLDEEEDTHL
ncbi:podocalyxin [Dasypus novemcinctus]|uniref:podocalyxin n=1 Tax=Dasypus novemcinctus TaxID=9361 RepID=UPI000328FA33|nr:podocalyxin [Dasypus novemcinctus]